MKWFFLSLLILLTGIYIFIQTPFGQNWIAKQVTKRLSRDLQTKISIDHVDFALFNKMQLQGVLIEDQTGDTLLYAGIMQVRITDWFFFKKEAELKYIGLENAIIKFQRSDSVWKQQFIFDYFASPSTGQKKKAGIQFNLKDVDMKNVTFIKKDGWLGEDMTVRVNELKLDADNLSLSGNEYVLKSLLVKEPIVTLRSYTRRKPSVDQEPEKSPVTTWNLGKTIFKIGNLRIVNGTFKTDNDNGTKPLDYFDGQHMHFTSINGELKNASFVGDTVFSTLTLSAKERSGLELKQLAADVKLTPQGMNFANLNLQTNRSVLRHFFSMSYNDISEMGDFIHKVRMNAIFDSSYVDSDDIAFFAPALRDWKKEISLNGKIRGTVDDLIGRDLDVRAGDNTLLNGHISLTGLPDINKTFIDFKANEFRTTYGDAVTFAPAIRKITTPDLRSLQYISFRGNFTGFIRDFVTFGTIQTNLGTVRTDLNMKLPLGGQPVYSGSIATENFRLGQFIRNKDLGSISLSGTLKGRGFDEKNINTMLDANVRYIDYKNYKYSNIVVKGRFEKKLFQGMATIRDINADLDLNGIIDFNNEPPRFDLIATVERANLKNLNLIKDDVSFRGKLNFNFTSSTIDNFLGSARITDAEIMKDGKRLPFDSLIISSSFNDTAKILSAVSNEFKINVSGDFMLAELPNSFVYFLNKYYPAYIKPPKRFPPAQSITFDIETQYIDEYIQLLDSSLSGFNFATIKGNLKLPENLLNLTAEVPQFKYKQYNFDNVKVVAEGTNNNLLLNGNASNIRLNDSLNIPMTIFTINAHNDSSRINITSGANRTVDTANLNALVLTYNDGVKIEFDPSTFTINTKTWSIDESGELVFRKNTPASGELILREGQQQIMLRTEPSSVGNWNDLQVQLTKVNMGDFAPLFLPKTRLEGLLSGNINIEDPTDNLKITSNNLQTEFLRIDKDSLGELKAVMEYDNKTKELVIKGNTLNQENFLDFNANLFFDPVRAKENLIALKARNFGISILERFLGTLFTDMQGFLTGDINISGEFSNLNVTGKGRLKDAGLRVIFTQCFYAIQDTEIELKTTEINMDGIVLTDTITGNPIYLRGGIEHESFKNMFYNLDISTQKPNTTSDADNKPVQLLNTNYNNNKQFYGTVKGTGSLSLLGPQSNMYMKIDANASTTDSSMIVIPSSTSRESGIADFLVERKYGREMNDSDLQLSATNAIYDVDVTANPMVTVQVVMDELTGDVIRGKGTGSLNIRSGTSEPLSLRGRFDIEEGNYDFTFQSFFKKPFELRKDAENYIEWNGDPMDANIKFEALYKAERVSFAPLVKLKQLSSGGANARGDVYVVAKLTEKLFQPKIEFSLDFPNTSVAVTDPELTLIIQQLQKNPTEINKQATYLIVFNSFAPSDELGGGDAVNGPGIGLNTISGIFLNVISEQLNKILGNLVKNEKYNITLNTSIYNRDLINQTNTTALNLSSNVNFSIGRSFFNNRFIISTGVGLDAPLQQSNSTIQQSIQLLPDVTLEWLINPSGSLRASFFYRENADYLSTTVGGGPGKAKRYGGRFNFRRDFDRLGDIFKKRKKPPIVQPQPVQGVLPTKPKEENRE